MTCTWGGGVEVGVLKPVATTTQTLSIHGSGYCPPVYLHMIQTCISPRRS